MFLSVPSSLGPTYVHFYLTGIGAGLECMTINHPMDRVRHVNPKVYIC